MDLSIIKKAVQNFRAIHGRSPSASELAQIERQASTFAAPTSGLRTGPSAAPRASYELATDLNLINPDTARDPFLTKMLTGRTTKGTNLRPMTQDINDPSVMKNIETKQMAGELDEVLPNPQSTTPTADYLAQQSSAIENEALSGGAYDKLKEGFAQKFGRYPDEDEMNALIADFNPARHQYGAEGVGIMSERPPTAKGMTEFRNRARAEGVPETYLTERAAKYPQYIKDELEIQRGVLPATGIKEAKKRLPKEVEPVDFYIDENGNVVKIYPTMKADGGQITPRDMLAEMIVNKVTPQKFAGGGSAFTKYATPAAINAGLFAPELKALGANIGRKKFGEAAGNAATIGLALAPLNPLTVGASMLVPSDLGDATLDTYLKNKEAERQAYLQKLYRESPVIKKQPQPRVELDQLGFPYNPEE